MTGGVTVWPTPARSAHFSSFGQQRRDVGAAAFDQMRRRAARQRNLLARRFGFDDLHGDAQILGGTKQLTRNAVRVHDFVQSRVQATFAGPVAGFGRFGRARQNQHGRGRQIFQSLGELRGGRAVGFLLARAAGRRRHAIEFFGALDHDGAPVGQKRQTAHRRQNVADFGAFAVKMSRLKSRASSVSDQPSSA